MEETPRDEKVTTANPTIGFGLRFRLAAVRAQHIPISALVLLSIPPAPLVGLELPAAVLVGSTGLAGMMFWKKTLASISSAVLLALLVWGKLGMRVLRMGSPDTALLLSEFIIVLLSMESSQAAITFHADSELLKGKKDELSTVLHTRLQEWLNHQLTGQAKIALAALSLSVVLLPLAGFTSISSSQLAISATLALAAMIVLLFLVTYKREPKWPVRPE